MQVDFKLNAIWWIKWEQSYRHGSDRKSGNLRIKKTDFDFMQGKWGGVGETLEFEWTCVFAVNLGQKSRYLAAI